jgi:hypothetical protein
MTLDSRLRARENIRIASFVMAGRINHARLAGVANETAH